MPPTAHGLVVLRVRGSGFVTDKDTVSAGRFERDSLATYEACFLQPLFVLRPSHSLTRNYLAERPAMSTPPGHIGERETCTSSYPVAESQPAYSSAV